MQNLPVDFLCGSHHMTPPPHGGLLSPLTLEDVPSLEFRLRKRRKVCLVEEALLAVSKSSPDEVLADTASHLPPISTYKSFSPLEITL